MMKFHSKVIVLAAIIAIIISLYNFPLYHESNDSNEFDVGNLVKLDSSKRFVKKKLAVIVAMKNSFEDLLVFVPHMTKFLGNQKIPFHIFVIQQVDDLRFNKVRGEVEESARQEINYH
jgi:hypothetical protein